MARIPTPWAFRYRIVVHASTPSTPSGPPHGRWSTKARLPERLGLLSGDKWVLFPAKSTLRLCVSLLVIKTGSATARNTGLLAEHHEPQAVDVTTSSGLSAF